MANNSTGRSEWSGPGTSSSSRTSPDRPERARSDLSTLVPHEMAVGEHLVLIVTGGCVLDRRLVLRIDHKDFPRNWSTLSGAVREYPFGIWSQGSSVIPDGCDLWSRTSPNPARFRASWTTRSQSLSVGTESSTAVTSRWPESPAVGSLSRSMASAMRKAAAQG